MADKREITIKDIWGAILFKGEFATVAEALAEAVKSRANLSRANLYGADLSGANLSRANLSRADLDRANLSRADLSGADLSGANLSRANLSRADLDRANLSRADLSGANLSRANLYGANLYGANLSGAKGYAPEAVNAVHLFKYQVGKIRAFKLVTASGDSPIHDTKINYQIGESYAVDDANTDLDETCGTGLHVATLDWCIREWQTGWRILIAEFEKKDLACIPNASDGKFRVHALKIVGEVDLAEIGLAKKPEPVSS